MTDGSEAALARRVVLVSIGDLLTSFYEVVWGRVK
jgi:hypothetical protein